ncbi:MAG: serine dehydratase subunit alpha family protein [Clostridiales bacterium]|nr:serine dehydratase subunit alpha family protein [Clostridiales bacterium]
MEKELYCKYVQILEEELLPAMGCTEPIALAYAAAKAKETLGLIPEKCTLHVCGNIIKNVKSVIVPNTGGLKGIPAALVAGFVAGNASKVLEVLSEVSDEAKAEMKVKLGEIEIEIIPVSDKLLYIDVEVTAGSESARVVIEDSHTNITLIKKNDQLIYSATESSEASAETDRSCLSVEKIFEFANTVDLKDVYAVIKRQIDYNTAISKEGFAGSWGAEIGKTILKQAPESIEAKAKAAAAAGSDARMSGCELPVIIVSGSGNQGMTASLPVITYAKELGATEEELYRAIVLSDLITIHQKTGIGKLSAFCGAVSAGCGAACGIAYLKGGDLETIAHTIVNTLAITSGMICDGAKPSCAAKIATAIDAGLLGYQMYQNGNQFRDGEGIIKKGVENTIVNVGRLASVGMKETDKEILDIMTK